MTTINIVEEKNKLKRGANMAYRLALALGQNAALLEAVERREVHPVMSAFGLWVDDEFESLTNKIYVEREHASSSLAHNKKYFSRIEKPTLEDWME